MTLYSPIIIKISFKGNSSSTGDWGREEQDKEQAIAVTELRITWSYDLKRHPWRTGLPPAPLPAAVGSSVNLFPPLSSSTNNQLHTTGVSMSIAVHFPLLHVTKALETRQTNSNWELFTLQPYWTSYLFITQATTAAPVSRKLTIYCTSTDKHHHHQQKMFSDVGYYLVQTKADWTQEAPGL